MNRTQLGRLPRASRALLALFLALPVVRAEGARPEEGELLLLRLRGGGIQWVRIESHTPELVAVRRLDNGGLVRLPWGLLDPAQEEELRTRLGYVDLDGDEPMLQADVLVLHDGRELVGRLLSSEGENFTLKQESGSLLIRKALVKEATTRQAAALEVYTREELYRDEAARLLTPSGEQEPAVHFELARYCERILDFAGALRHYERAAQLDPSFKAAELGAILPRVATKVQQQEQLDALAEIDRTKRRGYFDKAIQALASFDARYPGSPLRAERLKLEERVLKERERAVRNLVRVQWYSWIDRTAGEAARLETFEAAMAYVEDSMSGRIVQGVTEDARRIWAEVDEDKVRQLWIERERRAWKPASYGVGTWLLGKENALKGVTEAAPEAEQKSERDRAREDLAQQMQRFMRNQQIAKRASRSADDQQAINDFWTTYSPSSRKAWLVAYYAENSGEVDLRPRPEIYNCASCGGTGYREVIYTSGGRSGSSGGMKLEPCQVCHTLGVVRRIRYR